MTKKIALFGDSILKGVIYGDDKRYHISKEIDWRGIENSLDIELENFSKMGNCVENGRINLERFLKDCKGVRGVVLEYGGNDSDYFWERVSQNPSKDNLPKTVLAEFRNDLLSMIALLKKKKIRPILMTLPPIIAERYFNFIVSLGNNPQNIKEFLGDVQIIYRRHELYSNEIVKIAREQNVDIVDVRSKFLQSNDLNNLICEDGIHPNVAGQKLIVQTFSDYFIKKARKKKDKVKVSCKVETQKIKEPKVEKLKVKELKIKEPKVKKQKVKKTEIKAEKIKEKKLKNIANTTKTAKDKIKSTVDNLTIATTQANKVL